ncbi:dihydroorotase [Arthrobacter agilis]|uniref:dihydroorotase n=1 Tax=Arthrobacter agilis TaxID=37921 RepID=UPI000B34CE62|nr:dihydroorotase [Arthrobacter agilis]OUM45241.1 dihydroorotase [Arthrobacter agilis]PPB47495.1 dihydroorotase [Arthrobacter agilis]TPV21727.1 dihydroorotase [Arthrobacter agilis]VDR32176.1 Dihydroorotase [Arthrobacter agilis]
MSPDTTTDRAVDPAQYLIRGVSPLGGEATDLLVRGGVIAASGPDAASGAAADAVTIEADGLVALPGMVDLHTHLREPGREDAETVETGSRAAALGGFTAIHAMANSSPVADTAGVVEQVYRLGLASGWVEVRPVGAVTVGLAGERLAELGAMAESRASVRVFSDDGICVHDPVLMRRALEYVKAFDGVIAQHAQEPRLTEGAQMNEGEVSAVLGLTGWPAVAEESIIARDVLLAQHVGSRLHVCHVSTAGSVEIIRWAKARGIDVTAEVTPHHLLLTDELVRSYDPVYKVNPPLRTSDDVHALRAALADGTIDVVGTDHAPHPSEHKECEWAQAAMGMTGLETALSVVQHTMVETGLLDWAGFARVTSVTPARIGRLDHQGRPLAVGEPANLILVDPAARWTVDPTTMATKGRNSPFRGLELPGRVRATFFEGHPTVLDGHLSTPRRGQVPATAVDGEDAAWNI